MTNEREEQMVPGSDAAAMVSQGEALVRVENETLMRVAKESPRDEGKIIKGAMAELELVPEEAHRAYYSIPYKERGEGGTKTVFVEGPSIKSAMALARRWGNCLTGARPIDENADQWIIEGVFIDAETGFRIARPFIQSKWYKVSGRFLKMGSDKQMMAYQAGVSKAIRNAVLAALPTYLVHAYVKKAKALVGGKLDVKADPKAVGGVITSFAKLGVSEEKLVELVGLPSSEWTGSTVAELRGIFTAIQDDQTTVQDVFNHGDPGEAPEPQSRAESGAALVEPGPTKAHNPTTEAPPEAKKGGADEFKLKQCRKILGEYGIEPDSLPANLTDSDAMAIINAGSSKKKVEHVLADITILRKHG